MQRPKVGGEWSSETTTVRPFGSVFTAVGMRQPAAFGAARATGARRASVSSGATVLGIFIVSPP